MIQKGLRIEKKILTYKTRKEDNLQQICLIFNTTPYRLRELNPLINLDDIKQGISLLVEVNSSGKEGASIQNPNQFRQLDAPDMTFMKKPLFIQIIPVENTSWDKQDVQAIEEFSNKQASPMKVQKLNITTEVYYKTLNGNVPGILTISSTELIFAPDVPGLVEILEQKTTRKEKDVTQEVIERYSFNINLEDVYLLKHEQEGKFEFIDIFIFGVLGVDPPLKDASDNFGMIQVQIISKGSIDSKADEQLKSGIQQILNVPEKPKGSGLILVKTLLDSILNQPLYQDAARLFQKVLKKAVIQEKLQELNHQHFQSSENINVKQFQDGLNMKCVSEVSFYNIVPVKQMESLVIRDKRLAKNLYKRKDLPSLKSRTQIIDMKQFEQILKNLPSYSQINDWFLMYSPTQHGTSYQELFRRLSFVGPHVLLIRDQQDTIFGAYLSDSWKKTKDKYYGSVESFLFTFRYGKFIKVYHWSKRNSLFQMANEEGLHIGADERPGITIHHELLRGSSFPCETFENEVLASDYNFKIIEMEFWGLSQDCEIILRHLRQKTSFVENQY